MPKKKKNVEYKIAYYDSSGKRRGKTFTAPTMKEARLKAALWEKDHPKTESGSMTVLEAVGRYIDIKAETLSPSTVASYKDMKRVHIDGTSIAGIKAELLTDSEVQIWISDLARKGLSVKTINNIYSLVSSTEKMFYKKSFDVTIGQPKQPELYCPSNDDIKKLMEWIRSHKRDSLERAVLLAAFGPMRRGEICALTSDDIKGNTVSITKAVVLNDSRMWEIKVPKTKKSYRQIVFPDFVIAKLQGIDGKIIKYTPHALGEAFREAVRESGVPHFRFHDLRHYGASIMHYMGISDKTIQTRGGWSTPYVMKRVYQNQIDAETKRENEQINKYFAEQFAKV